MSKMKKIIIVAIIIILIIIAAIIGYMVTNQKKDLVDKDNNNVNTTPNNNIVENNVQTVKDSALFYTIENCIKKYEGYVNTNYEKQVDERNLPSLAASYGFSTQEDKNSAIMNFLDQDYIKENNINKNNLNNFIEETNNEDIIVTALKINKLESDNSEVNSYSVYAKKSDGDNEKNIYYIIKLDESNEAFCIYPLNKNYKNIDEINVKNQTKNIEKNNQNAIIQSDVSDAEITTKYFQEFKELVINKPEEAYDKLDVNYRNKRFGSLDEFKKYVNANIDDIELSQILKYLKEENDNYNEYVAKDRYENLYIFDEESPNNYTVKLDTYTIVTDKFKSEYSQSEEERKVQLQLDVFRQMINNQDFKSAYNVLADGFKNNYFKTQDSFEEYMRKHAFKYNKINFEDINQQGNLYVCKANFTDLSEGNYEDESKKDVNQYDWTFIVQLNDAENFKLSFSIE